MWSDLAFQTLNEQVRSLFFRSKLSDKEIEYTLAKELESPLYSDYVAAFQNERLPLIAIENCGWRNMPIMIKN